MAAAFSLGGSLLAEAEDVLEAVLEKMDTATLCQLKAVSVGWGNHVRRELCDRLWVQLSRREGQPEPAGVDSITDLDVECLKEAGRPWEVVVAGRQLPQLARLHGWGFVVDVQAVREADLEEEDDHYNDDDEEEHEEEEDAEAPIGGDTLRSCIQGEGQPPHELLLAAVACAASGTVRGVPVERLREDDAIDELDFGESVIRFTGATLLAFMLPAAMSVRSLDIGGNEIGDEGAAALAAVLKETQITNLDLSGNYIGDEGASALAAILKETMISSLSIWNNRIGVEGVSTLAAILKETMISNLNLARNKLCGLCDEGCGTYTTEGITKLCEGLKGSAVTSLNLAGNKLCGLKKYRNGTYTTKGITKLCEGLKESNVTSLCLWGNPIGDAGASALAAVLKETQITNLDISSNGLGPKGAAALAEGLKGSSTLQSLELDHNQLCGLNYCGEGRYTAEGITKLCEALKGGAVTSLSLTSNQLCGLDVIGHGTYTAEGITKLCKALTGSAVTSLNIGNNRIGVEGVSALAAILKETTISNLNIKCNKLTDEAKRALRDAAGSSVRIEF